MGDWLKEHGLSEDRLIIEDQSMTTAQNAEFSYKIILDKYPLNIGVLDNHPLTSKGSLTLDDLAERFYINKFYLARLFREQYGSSVINYLLYLRISRAKELLRFTEMTVEEVGARCGMPDANYFSRAFRKIEGMSPSEFRKLW